MVAIATVPLPGNRRTHEPIAIARGFRTKTLAGYALRLCPYPGGWPFDKVPGQRSGLPLAPEVYARMKQVEIDLRAAVLAHRRSLEEALDRMEGMGPSEKIFVSEAGVRYRTARLLAEGGLGQLYLTEEGDTVVKVLRGELGGTTEEWLERFKIEARVAQSGIHPGILRLIDFHLIEPPYFIVFPFVRGTTLGQFCFASCPETAVPKYKAEILTVIIRVCEILEAAELYGLYHRDLKPEHIQLALDTAPFVSLLDFGLVDERRDEFESIKFPRPWVDPDGLEPGLRGTPGYMAPETMCQLTEAQRCHPRVAAYPLGVIMGEACLGRKRFEGLSAFDVLSREISQDPFSAEQLSLMPEGIAPLLQRWTARDPSLRPQTFAEMKHEAAELLMAT